jgi:hypothetical protein
MLPFLHPSNILIAASSQSGKTYFTIELVKNNKVMFSPPPDKILWIYSIYQKSYNCIADIVEFSDVIPSAESFGNDTRTLVILDDLMQEAGPQIEELFTRGSHHKNLTVIHLTQNLFYKSKCQRTLSLNSHYIILFKNVRDVTQIATLARQMYPSRVHYMVEAYKDATSVPYGYLLIDLRPETEERFRLRSGILPSQVPFVYVMKN